jgi:ribosomal protein S18 acetylase RimI-like enzyme
LQAMITKSHKHSHFFREVRFPQEKTKELFAEWIRKCAGGLADIIFVAEKNESIIGFCSLLSNTSLLNFIHKKVGIIDFIVVDETAQGLGIGKSLLDRTFAHFADTGLIELRTMADNIGAIRFYHHNGFSILSSDQYYHYWT